MRYFTLTVILISLLITAGCSTAPKTAGDTKPTINQLSATAVQNDALKPGAQFIDVRTPEEFVAGHAEGAVNIPLDKLESEYSKLNKNQPVYLICQTGRRSQKAAEQLAQKGFRQLINIEGGTSAWTASGLPLEK